MDTQSRRQEVKRIIEAAVTPISASQLAQRFSVSRQVIVGDVALLRAEGLNIIATARGYVGNDAAYAGNYVGKLACRHSSQDTREELLTMVENGAHVLNVVVEHAAYGEITGQLGLTDRSEVDEFIKKLGASRPLSALTDGVHLHTLACPDRLTFFYIKELLEKKGFLYPETENA